MSELISYLVMLGNFKNNFQFFSNFLLEILFYRRAQYFNSKWHLIKIFMNLSKKYLYDT